MTDEVMHISLSELIDKHRHNGGAASTYEFSHLWITSIGSPEGDLSGIIIKDSTFSGVDFANVALANAKLSNVQFEAASNLTIACNKRKLPLKSEVFAQQLTLQFETSSAPSAVSAAPSAPNLSTIMQKLGALNDLDIRALIEESKRRIRESQQPDKRSQYRRPEQERFRRDLLDGYDRQCAITAVEDEDILQAAHIIPFCLLEKIGAGRFGNSRWNGVLLRQELHTLFDQNTLTITKNGEVSVDSYYQGLYNRWEQSVLPPRPASFDDPQTRVEYEQIWRSFLQWRWEEYYKYC